MNRLTRYRGRKDLLSQLHEDFNRLLEPFDLPAHLGWPGTSVSDWVPSIDVKEEENQYIVHADVPGVKAADIEVTMENGTLAIKGKRESEKTEEKENYLRVERSRGSFIRQLTLPEAVDQGKIEAHCQNGVLELILPKAKGTAEHKIKVNER